MFDNQGTQINEGALVSEIQLINPRVSIMMICFSQFLDLMSLLERVGLFVALRMNQDLNILQWIYLDHECYPKRVLS